MSDIMGFPLSWEDFAEQYSFNDSDEVYTNGSRLMQLLRVKQMVEHYFAEPLSRPSVVRCRDCAYYEPYPNIISGEQMDIGDCWKHSRETNNERFCAWGKRR